MRIQNIKSVLTLLGKNGLSGAPGLQGKRLLRASNYFA